MNFKTKTFKQFLKGVPKRMASSAMLLENSVGQLLIVKANYKSYWTTPGGIIDVGETPQQAAIRETYEEVGIQLDPAHITFVAVINRKSDFADTFQFVFKASLSPGAAEHIVLQASEIDEYALVTKDQIKSGDRHYGKILQHWAQGREGYIEQTFSKDDQ